MTDFINQTSELTARWLTGLLTDSGALKRGAVEHVEVVRELNPPMSVAACIVRATYSTDANDHLPERFFFKIGRRPPEVTFYQHIASYLQSTLPMVHCYHAHFANELGISNLLFDDISESHATAFAETWETKQNILSAVDILAALHRCFWQHPDLAPNGKHAAILDNLTGFVLRQVQAQFAEFVDTCGDRLSEQRRGWYERILACLPHPAWRTRIAEHRAVTLVHGDVQAGNFSFPLQPAQPIYLLDWGLWHINLPTYDLAYLIALRWPSEQRQRLEREILEHYHARLNRDDYDQSQLWHDYRLSVIYHTIWPIFWHRMSPEHVWLQHLDYIMSAFEDLKCEELL